MGQDVFKIDITRDVRNNSMFIATQNPSSGLSFTAELNPFDIGVVPSGTYDKMANWYDYEDQAYDTGTP